MNAERGRVVETIRHEGGRSHPADRVCLRCVGEVAEQRDDTLLERAERAEARVALLEGLLCEHEWEGYVDGVAACLACGRKKRDGHAPACPLGVALNDEETRPCEG